MRYTNNESGKVEMWNNNKLCNQLLLYIYILLLSVSTTLSDLSKWLSFNKNLIPKLKVFALFVLFCAKYLSLSFYLCLD